jgi:hypothetical protein
MEILFGETVVERRIKTMAEGNKKLVEEGPRKIL